MVGSNFVIPAMAVVECLTIFTAYLHGDKDEVTGEPITYEQCLDRMSCSLRTFVGAWIGNWIGGLVGNWVREPSALRGLNYPLRRCFPASEEHLALPSERSLAV